MKRWVVRIVALSAVAAGGWFAVGWAQQHLGSQSQAPLAPDFSKAPVNQEATAAWNEAQRSKSPHLDGGQGAGSRGQGVEANAPSDPFQNVTLASGETNQGSSRTTGGRYGAVEPRALDADPNAAPIAADAAQPRNIGAGHDDIPAAGEAGLSKNRVAAQALTIFRARLPIPSDYNRPGARSWPAITPRRNRPLRPSRSRRPSRRTRRHRPTACGFSTTVLVNRAPQPLPAHWNR